jgi:hypothetical protein
MRPQKRAYILLFILFIPCFEIAQSQIQIIPKPVSLTAEDGHFIIDKNTSLFLRLIKMICNGQLYFSILLLKAFQELLCH